MGIFGAIEEAFENVARSMIGAIEAAWDKVASIFTSQKINEPAAECPVMNKTMTLERAKQYIDDFKTTDIPFDYPVDCCFARARVMCGKIENDGYECNKFWFAGNLYPKDENDQRITFPDQTSEIEWGYHVAPKVKVKGLDGSEQDMILDPSLSDKPLTEDEWKSLCNPIPAQGVEYTSDSQLSFPFNNEKTSVLPDPTVNGMMTVDEANDWLGKHKRSRDLAKLFAKP